MGARDEIQVLDSYENPTYFEGQCASVYNQTPPMVNASRKPGEWQTYDIVFNVPHFDADGKVASRPTSPSCKRRPRAESHRVKGYTYYDKPNTYTKHAEKLPLVLMYHGDRCASQHLDPRREGTGGQAGEGEGLAAVAGRREFRRQGEPYLAPACRIRYRRRRRV